MAKKQQKKKAKPRNRAKKVKIKKSKPSFVVTVPLATSAADEHYLLIMMIAAQRIYNHLVQWGKWCVRQIKKDPEWELARKMPRTTDEQKKARGLAFQAVKDKYLFSDYAVQNLALKFKNEGAFYDRLGSHIVQKLATKVFKSFNEYLFGTRGLPRFKSVHKPLRSLEGKTNTTMLKWDPVTNTLQIREGWSIGVTCNLVKDEWLASALQSPVKYCRIVRKNINGKFKYYVQLTMDGYSPLKASQLVKQQHVVPGTEMGLDLGPSDIAYATKEGGGLIILCEHVQNVEKELCILQRKAQRQTNALFAKAENQGKSKKEVFKNKSKKHAKTQADIASLHGKVARARAQSTGENTNLLMSMATDFKDDGVSIKALQKMYGKSVLKRQPGLFMSELTRKAERAGGKRTIINSYRLKTSQYDHSTNTYTKKPRNQDVHVFGDGRGTVQRDYYSAFLALHSQGDEHEPELLEREWLKVVDKLGKLYRASEKKDRISQEPHLSCVTPPAAGDKLQNIFIRCFEMGMFDSASR
jgi:putative transposase